MNQQRNAALAILFAVALALSACSSDDGQPTSTATVAETTTTTTSPPATAPDTTNEPEAPTTTTTEPGPSAEETASLNAALDVKDSFFVAFNAADPAAVMGLFTVDAQYGGNFGPMELRDFEELLAWNTAQGTRYTPSDCTATADTASSAVVVSCPFVTHDAPSISSGGPPVPFTMSMVITPEGIASYQDQFGNPDFNVVGEPFARWMEQHHPEDAELVAFGSWNTIEEAGTNGALVFHYATEWGKYLEANNCGYSDNC